MQTAVGILSFLLGVYNTYLLYKNDKDLVSSLLYKEKEKSGA
ncbi:MAG: hypothetical protein R3Y64_01410 [Peptostreptococcaceae bacterium]